ncbi:hypothetical protein GSI_11964 [Ganoderma sinense ZZ0214-1]|uniref:Uncharacterized protein n=1 Tax=Ganoderma sinense ZZ0214-1 TaxID=1077348 RepID=A0A2G8RXF9_9APHY|nr:hypothetical protein GSI_11964 [Ganoderma sinense ZZ0214-1]
MDPSGLPGVLGGALRPAYNARQAQGLTKTLLSPFELLLLTPRPEAIDDICFCWTPEVLLKIRQLSSAAFYAIEAYFCRQMNIHHHMRRWVPNVQEFFHQLTLCDGLISGSEALSFLDRRRFIGHDLDIYLPPHGVLAMGRFLKSCGYVYQAPSGTHLMFDAAAMLLTSRNSLNGRKPGASSAKRPTHKQRKTQQRPGYVVPTFDFVRPMPPGLSYSYGTHVQLMAVPCDPMEFIINNFHSTGVMNVLTATHAISVFPNTTFNYEQTCVCQDLSGYPDWTAPWMPKYRERGFNVLFSKNSIPQRAELVTWKRRVGDTMTWIFPYRRMGEYPYCLNGKPPILDSYSRYTFEVLDVSYGVTPTGAALRVGPRSAYRRVPFSAAWILNPDHPRLCYTYFSSDLSIAFSELYQVSSDEEFTDSDSSASADEEGDTEEAD